MIDIFYVNIQCTIIGHLKMNQFFSILGLNITELEKRSRERYIQDHGLGVITAALFLAGEMAGSGVLALPNAMIGTGIL